MTDRELLEAAATAAGLTIEYWAQDEHPVVSNGTANVGWNPLTFDSDALRLAVALRLHVDHSSSHVTVWIIGAASAKPFRENGTTPEVTRRAIVRAAASMAGRHTNRSTTCKT